MQNNYLKEYHNAIKKGKIKVCNRVKTVLEILEKDLESGEYSLDLKFSNMCIDFIETFCHHSKTRNDLIKLELWQKAIITAMLGIKYPDGKRRFNEILLILPRKQGKSTFVSALICTLMFLDGEYGGEIYCLGPTLKHAEKVFIPFLKMCESSKVLNKRTHKRKGDLYHAESNTTVEMVAFVERSMNGTNPSIVVCDEIHAWKGSKGVEHYEEAVSGTGARKNPIIISITTAGREEDGIYDQLYLRADKFLKGDSEETNLLPFIYQLDDIEKWDDIETLKTCNPNYGVSILDDFYPKEIIKAKTSPATKSEFLMKYCCIKQNSYAAWLNREDLMKHFKDMTLEDFNRCHAVGGVDLSQRIDLTACSVVIKRNGIYNVFVQFFMPADRLKKAIEEDNIPYDIYRQQGFLTLSGRHNVDYKDCVAWFNKLDKQYKIPILKIGYDRYMAMDFVADMKTLGFHMDDVHQGTNLSPILTNFEGYFREGKIKFHNNNLLKVHFLNVGVKTNLETRKRQPIKLQPNSRIDGFVSVIDAFTMLDKYHNEIGNRIENEGR